MKEREKQSDQIVEMLTEGERKQIIEDFNEILPRPPFGYSQLSARQRT